MNNDRKPWDQLQETIGYLFREPMLLDQAMSHSSYVNEHKRCRHGNNERLEFLGDAVLELISSDYLYGMYPKMPEGELTKLRASLVCEPTLAMCARAIRLPDYMLLGRGEEMTGGRNRDSIVSDAMEALIGAIYLDGGMENARSFVHRFILNDIEHKKLFYDSKTILQEVIQRDYRGEELSYELVDEQGPDHAKLFRVNAMLGSRRIGEGTGSTKKAAEQEAAYRALLNFKQDGLKISS